MLNMIKVKHHSILRYEQSFQHCKLSQNKIVGSMVTVNLSIVEFESNFHDLKKKIKWGSNSQVFLKIKLRTPKSFVEFILHIRNKESGIKCANYLTFCELYYLSGK